MGKLATAVFGGILTRQLPSWPRRRSAEVTIGADDRPRTPADVAGTCGYTDAPEVRPCVVVTGMACPGRPLGPRPATGRSRASASTAFARPEQTATGCGWCAADARRQTASTTGTAASSTGRDRKVDGVNEFARRACRSRRANRSASTSRTRAEDVRDRRWVGTFPDHRLSESRHSTAVPAGRGRHRRSRPDRTKPTNADVLCAGDPLRQRKARRSSASPAGPSTPMRRLGTGRSG